MPGNGHLSMGRRQRNNMATVQTYNSQTKQNETNGGNYIACRRRIRWPAGPGPRRLPLGEPIAAPGAPRLLRLRSHWSVLHGPAAAAQEGPWETSGAATKLPGGRGRRVVSGVTWGRWTTGRSHVPCQGPLRAGKPSAPPL